MADELIFMMGEFDARFPTDRLYAKNHMWAQPLSGGAIRCGFSAYAVRLLQDVYFLEWDYAVGTPVRERALLFSQGTRVFHAAALGGEPQAEALEVFFGGLKLAR